MNLYLASYVLCIGIKKMFRKLLKILNQQDPNFFSVCFIRAMVCVPLPTFFAVFRSWHTKLMRRENRTKLKNLTFDLNLLLAPTRAHQVFICNCFLVVSLFMLAGFFMGIWWRNDTINDNDMLSYSLTTMMCFLTKEWHGFPAYAVNLFIKAYHNITYKEDLKIA